MGNAKIALSAGGVLLLLGAISDVGGAFSTIAEVMGWAKAKSEPILSLVNLNSQAGLERGSPDKSGVNLTRIQAILRNDGHVTLWATVNRVMANLGDSKCAQDAVDWPKLEISPSISVELAACSINEKILPGDRRDGRIDIEVIYGASPDKLDKSLLIRGSIAVEGLSNGGRIVWSPDGYSALPKGQKPSVARVNSDQPSTDSALDQEANIANYQLVAGARSR